MSGRGAAAEGRILDLFKNQNRPFSAQTVADFVAQFGIKKTQVQKTLDTLAEQSKITVKEFGKTKIFWPLQSTDDILSKEEVEEKKKEVSDLKKTAAKEAEELSQLRKEYAQITSLQTMDEIDAEIEMLNAQREELQQKLSECGDKSVPISPEERNDVEKKLQEHVQIWKKYKSAFTEIWGALSEGMDRKSSELFEEIGVETDEESGFTLADVNKLIPDKRRKFR